MAVPEIALRLGSLDPKQIDRFIDSLDHDEKIAVLSDWGLWQLPYQAMPEGEWRRWLFRAGRASGKTYTGARTTNEIARDRKKIRRGEIGIIGRTYSDARFTMVEGPSGILATAPLDFVPEWEPGNGILRWPNKVIGRIFSADKPESIRGPNFSWIWADEPAHWPNLKKIWWEVIELTLRLGWARCMLTTTPIADPALSKIEKTEGTVTTTANTFQNPYLDDSVREVYGKLYEGTRIGKQELYAEYLPHNEAALWMANMIDDHRVDKVPTDQNRIVVAIDPAVTAKEDSDETGIVVVGRKDDHGYVLEDLTMKGSPLAWATRAVLAYHRWRADHIVAETNNGGDLVETVIHSVDPNIKVVSVHASRGKITRAEPVAAMYEKGNAHHVGEFPDLEEQMTTWDPSHSISPDRIDALVWGFHDLFFQDARIVGPLKAYL